MNTGELITRKTLLLKIRDRYDEDAWQEFTTIYEGYIRHLFVKMGFSYHAINDLCQNTLVKLWSKLPDADTYCFNGRFRSWLYSVVKNQARNHIRDKQVAKRRVLAGNVDNSNNVEELPSDSAFEELADREWNRYVAKLAWDTIYPQLPSKYKKVFKLYLSGKHQKDIAEQTGISYCNVRKCITRCRDSLKVEIKRLTNELL